jgi:putative hydrolase of the HAD superfamily
MASSPIKALFLDLGGVLLTNGWDRNARRRAAEAFHLDDDEMNERHQLAFDTYERGGLSLDDYLNRVVFHEKRSFDPDKFKAFMFAQSRPHREMIDLVRDFKARYSLKTVAISNEGRELAVYRIRTFRLTEFVDSFIVSGFVRFRKPDPEIYRMALDVALVSPREAVYVEDRLLFVEVARDFGIRGVHHTGFASTREVLEKLAVEAA